VNWTLLRPPVLTRWRIGAAFGVALTADALQLLLGPAGLALPDEVIDVIAMALVTPLIGFHPLLLPTFVAELIPIVGLLPTWTGCVALVVALRRRQQQRAEPQPMTPPPNVIDV